MSAFLNTPKKNDPNELLSENSRDCINKALDIDNMLFENTLDLGHKFADIAKQMAAESPGSSMDSPIPQLD